GGVENVPKLLILKENLFLKRINFRVKKQNKHILQEDFGRVKNPLCQNMGDIRLIFLLKTVDIEIAGASLNASK
ncbi:MAG: hypothetical protein WAM54_11745, partial [Nitrososphaeraceae archaeon]